MRTFNKSIKYDIAYIFIPRIYFNYTEWYILYLCAGNYSSPGPVVKKAQRKGVLF